MAVNRRRFFQLTGATALGVAGSQVLPALGEETPPGPVKPADKRADACLSKVVEGARFPAARSGKARVTVKLTLTPPSDAKAKR